MARRRANGLFKHLAEAEMLLADERRFIDMRLEFQAPDGARLLSAGGRWDLLTDAWATTRAVEVWTPEQGWGRQEVVLRREELEARPAEAPPLCTAHIVTVEPSQIDYTLAFAEYLYALHNDLPRPSMLDILAGNRRGGKTWIMVACVIAAALACPRRLQDDGLVSPLVAWLVVPSYPEQREVHEDLQAVLQEREQRRALPQLGGRQDLREALEVVADGFQRALPSTWYQYRPNPNNCYVFRHGAELYLKSANTPDSLKQGRVDIIGINEMQKIEGDAIIHCLGNAIDFGGLAIGAANPPRRVKGQYLLDLKQRWEEGYFVDEEDGQKVVRFFFIKPELNRRINQPARRKFRMIAEVVNPKLARADAEAEWDAIYDLAYLKWANKKYDPTKPTDESGNILEAVPAGWQDVTREVIGAMQLREYRRHPGTFSEFGGIDFNKYPWMAAVKIRAFRDPTRTDDGRWAKGLICYVLMDEARTDPDLGMFAVEEEFADELQQPRPDGKGWNPNDVLLIGDATGQWQNSKERKKGGVEAGHSSFDLFKSGGWEIHAPTTIKMKRKEGGPRATTWYRPPRVIESLDKVNELLGARRFFVLECCPHACEAFRKCSADDKTGKPDDPKFSHITDAARYALWRAEAGINPRTGTPGMSSGGGGGRRRQGPAASLTGGRRNWM